MSSALIIRFYQCLNVPDILTYEVQVVQFALSLYSRLPLFHTIVAQLYVIQCMALCLNLKTTRPASRAPSLGSTRS